MVVLIIFLTCTDPKTVRWKTRYQPETQNNTMYCNILQYIAININRSTPSFWYVSLSRYVSLSTQRTGPEAKREGIQHRAVVHRTSFHRSRCPPGQEAGTSLRTTCWKTTEWFAFELNKKHDETYSISHKFWTFFGFASLQQVFPHLSGEGC